MTLSKAWRQFRVGMIVGDAATIVGTYVLADLLRCRFWMETPWPEFVPGVGSTVRIHLQVLAFLPLCWPILLSWLGWYQQRWRSVRWTARTIISADILLGLLMAALALLFARELYPRAQIGFVLALLPATSLAARGINAVAGRWISSRNRAHVLIVGTDRSAVRIRRLLRTTRLGRSAVIGHLRGPWETGAAAETGAILGDISELGPILDRQVVDEVIFCSPLEALPSLFPAIRLCEEIGVTAQVCAEPLAAHPGASSPEIVHLQGVPLLSYSPVRHSPELLSVKRGLDVIFAILGIILTGPIMLVCSLLIKATSRGPILFRQRRSGLNGREFGMFKFRTMQADAEAQRETLEHMNEADGPVFKISEDPRVTALGRFLRRWSLDELPQLFNVFLGDMSIVGPRPPIPAEVAQYDRWQRRRLSMRPGLTCLWQVKGRHRIGFDEWMNLDLFYIDHWSLKLDFLIICRTVAVVLGGTGV
jgi:exopolysaccharide biosynthesis polyprenyl glycosylphosphotransferase